MIHVSLDTYAGRWFVWVCDHLPMSRTRDYSSRTEGIPRLGAYYLERGTTLCHLFWITFWVPVIWVSLSGLFLFFIGMMHYGPAHDPKITEVLGSFAFLLPELVTLSLVLLVGTIVLIVMGASKVGINAYLKALKQRVCPLVTFKEPS